MSKKEKPTTKWCPVCHSSQKISGFRSYRCKECWIAAGKPKTIRPKSNDGTV